MSFLLTSDIHMTANPRDEYRWGLFQWLADTAKKSNIDEIIILGDFTDAKDRHSAQLVNRFVDGIYLLSEQAFVHLLKANHDYIDEKAPFFKFTGRYNNVVFHMEPEEIDLGSGNDALFLPSTRNYEEEWKEWLENGWPIVDYIFCHQTFEGAVGQNGFTLPGIPTDIFKGFKGKIYSGDIHAPGKVGPVEYVGAPYRTDFGSVFTPRCILVDDNGVRVDIRYPCPSRYTVTAMSVGDLKHADKIIREGDQVKLRVMLRRADLADYPKIVEELKAEITNLKWELCGVELKKMEERTAPRKDTISRPVYQTPEQRVRDFAKVNDLTKEQEELGVSLLA